MPQVQFRGWVYAAADGRQVGPVPTEEICRLLAAGVLHPPDKVWKVFDEDGEVRRYETLAGVALGQGFPGMPGTNA